MSSAVEFDEFWKDLAEQSPDAARTLLKRYASALIQLAEEHLDRRVRSLVEPDDVLQTALRTFVRHHGEGAYDCGNWESLWGLLALITRRKCYRANQRYLGPERDVRRNVAPLDDPQQSNAPPWVFISHEPTVEEAVYLAELLEQLLRGLSERACPVVVLHLKGFTDPEISQRTGVSERTIRRVLQQFRLRARELGDRPGETP
jgi:RNA polymerase sigma factor (sigma-70 family)